MNCVAGTNSVNPPSRTEPDKIRRSFVLCFEGLSVSGNHLQSNCLIIAVDVCFTKHDKRPNWMLGQY